MADDLVELLLAHTGLYVGTDHDPARPDRAPQIARIKVSALPRRVGVIFDYEGIRHDPKQLIGHAEHAVLARTANGLVLYSASNHAPTLIELRETAAGYFEAADGSAPFALAIQIEVPAAGRLIYTWLFGEPGGEVRVGNIGDVYLTTV